ncbi:unnamed protein product [Cyclocybe aegerita]|uniref:Transcription elongation factor Eaf N-terminal domain-containing protein n=1 Tax=Cyclocybe aegerita TaxID=1973307 RepID=A0A8S0XYW2_CYCAE|nr:unnamed protein product [Cyclocybe aegerita]
MLAGLSVTWFRVCHEHHGVPTRLAQICTLEAFSRFSLSGQKEHPFAKNFEVPQWSKFAWHTGFCGLAYPVLLLFVRLAQDRTLFWARLFTGVGCGIIGLILGISLLKLARGILEAATWATVIHQSRVPEGAGVRLKDLAAQSDDHASALTALKLIWDRRNYHGASREYRKFYDARPWSLWIILFLVNVIFAGVLPFVLARFVDIDVHIVHQYQKYYEITVKGDLSEADIKRASDLQAVFENYALTWTLAPFSVHGGLPPVVIFQYGNDTVYFSEVILSQFLPNGNGFGTFETDTTLPSIDADPHKPSQPQSDSGHDHHEEQEHADWLERGFEQFSPPVELEPGSLIKFPRWGIRIKCAKIPDQQVNIIPLSENNRTYVFTPRAALAPLFAGFAMNFPEILKAPFNFSAAMHQNDTVPDALRASDISLGAMFWDNGVAHSMKSTPLNMGEEGKGFVTVENILVRLNTTYAPHGKFDVLGPYPLLNEDGNMTYIGYDAAVCVELYEPWVLEVYNSSSGAPATMRIRDAMATLRDLEGEDMKGERITDPLVSRGLNSSHMWSAYVAGHQNSVNQIIKDNGRDFYYVPSPTLISFTGGQDPFSYTELSTAYYAKARALADAGNVLPYFVGSGMSVARQYHDRQSTTAVINKLYTLLVFLVVFLMGAISAFFVPRLPLDIPRRGFDLYSWMTAFQAQELVSERTSVFGKSMDLRDIKEHAGEIRFRYAGTNEGSKSPKTTIKPPCCVDPLSPTTTAMAATTASSAWMPSKGRHSVNIGPSLGRAIKARKLKDSPAPMTKKISRPERDFYAFRFNFKPSSIDNTKPASIEIKKGTENSQVVAEYPSKESNNEVHVFNGTEQPAKDIECILIYDEDTGQYTLEKLDSFVTLKSIGKKAISPRPASPAPAVSSSASSSSSRKGEGKQELDDNDDLERAILGLDDADADGEADDFMEIVPTAPHRPEEEHEEGEMSEDPPPPPPTKAAARPVKPLPKARSEQKPPAPPKPTPPQPALPPATIPLPPKPTPTPTPKSAGKQAPPPPAPTPTPAAVTSKAKTGPAKTKKTKAAPPSSLPAKPKHAPPTTYPEEEVIELPRPTKRSRPSTSTQPHIPSKPAPPPPAAPAPLSLPGGSGVFAPPPPPKPTSAPASPPALPADESDDDSDIWEQVPTTAVSQTDELEREIFGSKYGFKDEFIEVNGDDVEPLPPRGQSEDADTLLEREVFGDVVDEEEIDVNAFAAELDQEMQSEADADDDDMEEVVPGSATGGRPLSMNQLAAANAGVVDSDEEYSSSDDSDFD